MLNRQQGAIQQPPPQLYGAYGQPLPQGQYAYAPYGVVSSPNAPYPHVQYIPVMTPQSAHPVHPDMLHNTSVPPSETTPPRSTPHDKSRKRATEEPQLPIPAPPNPGDANERDRSGDAHVQDRPDGQDETLTENGHQSKKEGHEDEEDKNTSIHDTSPTTDDQNNTTQLLDPNLIEPNETAEEYNKTAEEYNKTRRDNNVSEYPEPTTEHTDQSTPIESGDHSPSKLDRITEHLTNHQVDDDEDKHEEDQSSANETDEHHRPVANGTTVHDVADS